MIRDAVIVLAGIVPALASPASGSQSTYRNIDYGVSLYDADGPNDTTYADGQRFEANRVLREVRRLELRLVQKGNG